MQLKLIATGLRAPDPVIRWLQWGLYVVMATFFVLLGALAFISRESDAFERIGDAFIVTFLIFVCYGPLGLAVAAWRLVCLNRSIRCIYCRYDCRGLTTCVCPECGARVRDRQA